MDPTARTTSVIVALVIAGILMGTVIGSLVGPDAKTTVQTVVRTETTTKTVTRTRTKTVTKPADTLAGDDPETGTTGENCSSAYVSACVPDDATEVVTCADIPERDFPSVGDDPYALDPDDDGTACES